MWTVDGCIGAEGEAAGDRQGGFGQSPSLFERRNRHCLLTDLSTSLKVRITADSELGSFHSTAII
jgi:hypothetical protein